MVGRGTIRPSGMVLCVDCAHEVLESVIDSSVVLRFQVTVPTDESMISDVSRQYFGDVRRNTYLLGSYDRANSVDLECDHLLGSQSELMDGWTWQM